MNDRQRAMWDEICVQPKTVKDTLHELRKRVSHLDVAGQRLLAGGCGDSFYAAVANDPFPHGLQGSYYAYTAQQLQHFVSTTASDTVVLSSISGNTRRTVQAAQAVQSAGAKTVAVTCNRDSDLARVCDEVLVLPYSPVRRDTPHTLDYIVNLLALCVINEQFSGASQDVLDELPGLLSSVIDDSFDALSHQQLMMKEKTKFFFLGSGVDQGTAMYGAAKLHEAGGLIALSEETENFVHGMNFVVDKDDVVVLFARNDQSLERARGLSSGLRSMGATVIGIGETEVEGTVDIVVPPSGAIGISFLFGAASQVFSYLVAEHLDLAVTQPRGGRDLGDLYMSIQKTWMKDQVP